MKQSKSATVSASAEVIATMPSVSAIRFDLQPLALAGLVSALVMSGCVERYAATPISDPSKSVTYSNGTPIVASTSKSGAVSVAWTGFNPQEDGKRLVFAVRVRNQGKTPANFGAENLSVSDRNGNPVRLWTADDLVSETEKKATAAKTAAVMGALFGVAASVAGSTSTTTGSYSGPNGFGTFSATTNNPAIAIGGSAASVGAASTGIAGINSARDQRISSIRSSYVQTTTVAPGQDYLGIFVVSLPEPRDAQQSIKLNVQWIDKSHEFDFKIQRSE